MTLLIDPENTMPGLSPGHHYATHVASEDLNSLRAALRGPGAGAAATGPGARAHAARETADAVGALVAVADLDRHRAVALYAALDVEGGVAGVDQGLAADVDRIAVGAVAIALGGDHHHAPLAIEIAGRLGRDGGGREAEADDGREGELGGARNGHFLAPCLGQAAQRYPVGVKFRFPGAPIRSLSLGGGPKGSTQVTEKVHPRFRDRGGGRLPGWVEV